MGRGEEMPGALDGLEAREGGGRRHEPLALGERGDVVGHVPEGLTVVPVGDFDDATEAVDDIAKGETADFATCEDVVAR